MGERPVGPEILRVACDEVTAMAMLGFVHGDIDIVEELHEFVAASVEPAVGDHDAGVAVGHRTDDDYADEL